MNREKELIEYLINNNRWVKTDELADILSVSTRTIRNIIKDINNNNEYIFSSSKGYKASDKCIEYLNNFYSKSNYEYTAKTRQNYIIKQLLIENKAINFYELADNLYISESTLNNDLLSIRKRLEKQNIIIVKKKEEISLVGDEKNMRSLMADSIYKELDNELITFSTLEKMFENYNVQKIKNIIANAILSKHLSFDDYGIIDITLHICIMLNRISNCTYENEKPDKTNNIYTDITKEIFIELEKQLNINIDDNEIKNIAPLIAINTKQILENSITIENLQNYVSQELIDFVMFITTKINDLYNIQLDKNDFVVRFSLHLNKTLQTYHHSTRNPLLKNIKDSYPLIFDISVHIANLITNKYPEIKLDDSEISYIALHVGLSIDRNSPIKINTALVIPDYYSLKDMIIEKLKSNFDNKIRFSKVCSNEEQIGNLKNIDLILSTSKIINKNNILNIQITPFINDADLHNIRYAIETILLKKKATNNKYLFELFSEKDFLFIENTNIEKEDVIKKMCSIAYDNNEIDKNFVESVFEREELSPTAFSNIAIPHTLNTTPFKTRIIVGISHKPIEWGLNQVNIVLLLVINDKDKEKFKSLFQTVISIFSSKAWNTSYQKIHCFNDLKNFLETNCQKY